MEPLTTSEVQYAHPADDDEPKNPAVYFASGVQEMRLPRKDTDHLRRGEGDDLHPPGIDIRYNLEFLPRPFINRCSLGHW